MHLAHAVYDVEGPVNNLRVYLPLSSCPDVTISSFVMTLRGRGGGGPDLNVIMTLIFQK